MQPSLIYVNGFEVRDPDRVDIRDEVWALALDQRAFGPRRLLVAFADRSARMPRLAYATRTQPPEVALDACIRHLGRGADAAVALCDEPVREGPPVDGTAERFERACAMVARHGLHLVDWIACDDHLFRSVRLALHPDEQWWPWATPE